MDPAFFHALGQVRGGGVQRLLAPFGSLRFAVPSKRLLPLHSTGWAARPPSHPWAARPLASPAACLQSSRLCWP
jgi:hypothetical protein